MKEEELEKSFKDVYDSGFKNGGIDMKNKILKSINEDWKLMTTKTISGLIMKILKKINKIK